MCVKKCLKFKKNWSYHILGEDHPLSHFYYIWEILPFLFPGFQDSVSDKNIFQESSSAKIWSGLVQLATYQPLPAHPVKCMVAETALVIINSYKCEVSHLFIEFLFPRSRLLF